MWWARRTRVSPLKGDPRSIVIWAGVAAIMKPRNLAQWAGDRLAESAAMRSEPAAKNSPFLAPIALESIAEIIGALGTEKFEALLYRYLERGISASVLFAYAIRTDGENAALLMSGTIETHRLQEHGELLREYAERGFTNDPMISTLRRSTDSSPFVKVRHAAEVADPDFRYRYFDKMSTPEELSIVGGQGSAELLYIGFSGHHFSDAETRFARDHAPLILALLQKDRELRGRKDSAIPANRDAALRAALVSNPARLTQREVEVCAQIMRGQSADAVASALNISKHTVITHRKRAYAKLRISSQGELFAKIYRIASAQGSLNA